MNIVDSNANPLTDASNYVEPIPIESSVDRLKPRQVGTGAMRGTQRITNTDGSYMTLGAIPNTTEFGIAFYTVGGALVRKVTMLTDYLYDATTGRNLMQIGKLPDASYNVAIAKSGFNISDGITP